MDPIYLDYNATSPLLPEVAEAMAPCLGDLFGNPSSPHAHGTRAKAAVAIARQRIASLLGADPDEIVLTSGGSESNNMAIKGVAWARGPGHLVTSVIEHPAVEEPCRWVEEQGFRVTRVPVDRHGIVDPAAIGEALRDDTILVTIMHANNEVGSIQPIAEIAAICRSRGVLLHTDAAQSVGKIPVHVGTLGVDLLSVAGHKLYGPKGIGALYVRRGVTLVPLIHGAGHEQGRRAGTEQLPGIVGLGAAAAAINAEPMTDAINFLTRLRERLFSSIVDGLPDGSVLRHGHPERTLPNTLSMSFRDVDASAVVAAVREHLAISAGAACHGSDGSASTILGAMGVPASFSLGAVRLSLGRMTTQAEVDRAAELVVTAVQGLLG